MNKKNNKLNGLEIAVIGMSGRFPKSNNKEEFFERIVAGEELISYFSKEELLKEGISIDSINDENYIRAKGVINNYDKFDSSFFGYTPKDAKMMDPQIRVFHECAWEALEDGGYNPETYEGTIGICAAASSNISWNQYILNNYGIENTSLPFVNKDFLATLVAYKLNLKGPAFMVNTACSSSLLAIHEACRSILTGESSMMLAGGVALSTPQKCGYKYQEGMIMSSDGHLRPFDINSSGAVGGNGVGVVLLKSLKRAIKDKDNIYAVIKGSAINNDGNRKVGFTAPSIEAQAKCIKKALMVSKVEPESIKYVETHGTGTDLGDVTEIEGLKRAFNTENKGFCALGAVKANIGHLDVASGIAGFIKACMMLDKKIIPPMVNFEAPNFKIPFIDSPFYIPMRKIPMESSDYPLRVGVSSFGIGGTNVHVVLEEKPEINENNQCISKEIIPLSANSENALNKLCNNLKNYLKNNKEANLKNIAYTLQIGRKFFGCRKVILCNSISDLYEKLSKNCTNDIIQNKVLGETKINLVLEQNEYNYKEYYSQLIEYKEFENIYSSCLESAKIDILSDGFEEEKQKFCFEYSIIKFLEKLNIGINSIYASTRNAILAGCIASSLSFSEGLNLYLSLQKYHIKNKDISVKKEIINILNQIKFSASKYAIYVEGKKYYPNIDFWKDILLKEKTISNTDLLTKENDIYIYIGRNGLFELDKNKNSFFTDYIIKLLGHLWVQGIDICWNVLYLDKSRYRISLPTYPFEEQEYKYSPVTSNLINNYDVLDSMVPYILEKEKVYREEFNIISIRKNKRLYNLANKLCIAYICEYLKKQDIKFIEGKEYEIVKLKQKLKIENKFDKLIDAFIRYLEEDKIIHRKENSIVICKELGEKYNPNILKEKAIEKYKDFKGLFELLDYCCSNYTEALSGEKEAISVLFPEGKSIWTYDKYKVNVEHSSFKIYCSLLRDVVIKAISTFNGQKVRILEVGAGNGILTKFILPSIKGLNVEYYFTDIGNYFIDKASKEYAEYDFVNYSIFDISRDPILQGYEANSFDIVVGLNVVHATKNIQESLNNIKMILKPKGILGLIESIHNERWYDMIDGLAEGWWYFEDTDLRQEPLISIDKWRECFSNVGFEKVYTYPFNEEKIESSDMGLVLGRKNQEIITTNIVKKVDNNLSEYQRSKLTNTYEAPVTKIEKIIANMLEDFFGVEQIGVNDNFYELGIDSIKAIQIAAKMQKLGYKIKMENILKYPTVKELVGKITEINSTENIGVKNDSLIMFVDKEDQEIAKEMIESDDNIERIYTLSPMQKNILGQNVLSYKKGLDVFSLIFTLEGNVNTDVFIKAWNKVVEKHTILRTAFKWKKLNDPIQIVYKKKKMIFMQEDLSHYSREEQKTFIDKYIENERKKGFKISDAPLTRGYIAKVDKEKYKFIWTFQHSLIDGWSMNIIINDLMNYYELINKGQEKIDVQPKELIDYISWINNQDIQEAKAFWKNEFSQFKYKDSLSDTNTLSNEYDMDVEKTVFSYDERTKIEEFSTKYNLTINTIIQTAYALAMKQFIGSNDIILAFETSGRSSEIEDIVSMAGIFISVLPYRCKLNMNCSCLEWMKNLQEKQLKMKNYEYVTIQEIAMWNKIPVKELQKAVYERTLVYQNFPNKLQNIDKEIKLNVDGKVAQLNIQMRMYVIPEDEFTLLINYNKKNYQENDMKKLLKNVKENIFKIICNENKELSNL